MIEIKDLELFNNKPVYVDYDYTPAEPSTEVDPPYPSSVLITKVVDIHDNDVLIGLTEDDIIELEEAVLYEVEKEMEQYDERDCDDGKYERDDWGIR